MSTIFLEASKYLIARKPALTALHHIYKSGFMENEQAVLALAALAQSTRLEAFRTLVKHEPDGIAAGDLARALEVPQNTLSAHLAILSRADLVRSERHSRSIVYRANLPAFQRIALFLLQDCCGGRPEICAPILESLQPCCPPKKDRSRA
jgi:DNA-binding transcriptional ArsR family regulator